MRTIHENFLYTARESSCIHKSVFHSILKLKY